MTAKPPQPSITDPEKKNDAGSKQARVIEMLRSPTGMTIAAMMKETGWQQHSVRGFLAGVVRKKLKLKLNSKKIDGSRVYRVDGADSAKQSGSGARANTPQDAACRGRVAGQSADRNILGRFRPANA
jgi:hypothetical protein